MRRLDSYIGIDKCDKTGPFWMSLQKGYSLRTKNIRKMYRYTRNLKWFYNVWRTKKNKYTSILNIILILFFLKRTTCYYFNNKLSY